MLDATLITLVPKKDKAKDPSEYRLFALCNVIYKVITNIIANQLKHFLPKFITLEHTGFI